MENAEIRVRKATSEDADELLVWRNDSLTRAMSFDSSAVTYAAHIEWFTRALNNPNRRLYVGEYSGINIGVCRFDLDILRSQAEISINMNPSCRGRGLATAFLLKTIQIYSPDNHIAILARTKVTNLASQKTFKKIGFIEQKIKNDTVYLLLPTNHNIR